MKHETVEKLYNNINVIGDTLTTIIYEYSEEVQNSILNTNIVTNDDKVPHKTTDIHGKIKFWKMNSLSAARKLTMETNDRVVVHNFANAYNPGGGVLLGADAQEENICRCSTLYPVLASEKCHNLYYSSSDSIKGSEDALYSEGIVVFKDDVTYQPIDPFIIDIVTCAAHDNNISDMRATALLLPAMESRISNVLKSCVLHGRRNVILGAFGCGAFKNDPYHVALWSMNMISLYANYFDNVIFALPDENYEIFKSVLE